MEYTQPCYLYSDLQTSSTGDRLEQTVLSVLKCDILAMYKTMNFSNASSDKKIFFKW